MLTQALKFVGFPGLGIENFEINPVAFHIFGRDIVWYGILISTGIILAVLYAMWRTKSEGIKADDVLDVAIAAIPFGIIGARLYFILFNLKTVHSFLDVIAVWNGGLAIYGGIIFGAATAVVVCLIKKISPLKMFDICAPAIMIGQIIGRWGNFMNVEVYGKVTNLPWRMAVSSYGTAFREVHPLFLYESLWNLLGFLLLHFYYKKKKFNGQIFLMYIAWYGFGRMLIEGLRDEEYILKIGSFAVSQLLGALCFVGGLALILVFSALSKRKALDSTGYENVFEVVTSDPALGEEGAVEEFEVQAEESAASSEEDEASPNDDKEVK